MLAELSKGFLVLIFIWYPVYAVDDYKNTKPQEESIMYNNRVVPIKHVTELPSECKGSHMYECVKCNSKGEQVERGGGCLCSFCINGDGKTIENADDMRTIFCSAS